MDLMVIANWQCVVRRIVRLGGIGQADRVSTHEALVHDHFATVVIVHPHSNQ